MHGSRVRERTFKLVNGDTNAEESDSSHSFLHAHGTGLLGSRGALACLRAPSNSQSPYYIGPSAIFGRSNECREGPLIT
jgi:hypothetical protein